jgi:hypothetical protein
MWENFYFFLPFSNLCIKTSGQCLCSTVLMVVTFQLKTCERTLFIFWFHCLIQATIFDLIRPWMNVNGTLTEQWHGQDVTGAWSFEAKNNTARIKVCIELTAGKKVYIEQWRQLQCYNCYRLAPNKAEIYVNIIICSLLDHGYITAAWCTVDKG